MKLNMMGCSKLCDWWCTQPPLAVFLLTLVACAGTLVSISVYVNIHQNELPNPNVRDWNSFYASFSLVELCIPSLSSNDSHTGSDSKDFILKGENVSSLSALVSFSMKDVRPDADSEAVLDLLKLFTIIANVTEDLLGVKVPLSRKPELLQVILSISKKPAKTSKKSGRSTDAESEKVYEACVTFKGPTHLLPNSEVAPRTCQHKTLPSMVVDALGAAGEPCRTSDLRLPVTLLQQQQLTPLLSRDETVLIQLHIVYTTCALTVLILLLLCYAVCRRMCHHTLPASSYGRPAAHGSGSSIEKVLLTE